MVVADGRKRTVMGMMPPAGLEVDLLQDACPSP
jgi:hypothetical protein